MPKGSSLNRYAKSLRAPGEQAGYKKRVARAVTKSAAASSSVGRITPAEKKAIRNLTAATRLVTTPGEAQGVKQRARRRARKS